MPAVSEPGPAGLPRTWRPLGVRIVGAILGPGLLVVCALAWIGFDAETQAKFTNFQRGTVVAVGLLGFAVWYALVRSRVVARPEGLRVVNGFRRHDLAWAQVVGVHLPPGAPWVTLDLADGTTVAAMGIQGSDGLRARRAVAELRSLVEQHTHH